MKASALVFAVLSSLFLTALSASSPAQDYKPSDVSDRVRAQCTSDAMRLCPSHPLGSNEMVYCMEAKARNISRDCQSALEDDGVVPRGHFKKRS
jgi:hypothetical protein